ncbi:MAG: hypothetical protein ABIO63_00230 [Casimicrobiaceae bacterium]
MPLVALKMKSMKNLIALASLATLMLPIWTAPQTVTLSVPTGVTK